MKAIRLVPILLLIGSTWCRPALADGSDEKRGSAAPQPQVVVEVDGEKVSFADFEQKLPGALFQARNTLYQAERAALDQFVGEYLLEREAKKEGVTVNELLERHVNSVIPKDPSEETLRVLYETIDTKESFEVIRGRIVEHLHDTRIAKAKAAYIQVLRNKANIAIRLESPRVTVSLKDTPMHGAADAPVVIVEYADYECPYCQQIQPALDKLQAEYKGKLTLAFKDSPLGMHAHAQKAAEAAHCAGAQGKYWEYHDWLFSNKRLDLPQLKEGARTLKLDGNAFDQCLDSGAQAATVKAEFNEAQALQVQGTPSFLINGRFFSGIGTEQIRNIIEEELSGSVAPVTQAAKQ
jgi:protein-disulfide isomerase